MNVISLPKINVFQFGIFSFNSVNLTKISFSVVHLTEKLLPNQFHTIFALKKQCKTLQPAASTRSLDSFMRRYYCNINNEAIKNTLCV